MMQKYQALVKDLARHERIFQDIGVPNPQGGYYREPIPDEDGFPRIEKFYINPRQITQRIADLNVNGWVEFQPPTMPEAVKKADEDDEDGRSRKRR